MNDSAPLILVVDDQESIRDMLRELLSFLGYRVELAANGAEALESIGKTPPDIVITDLQMPELDGFELTRRLKNDPATRIIPIVILTGLSDSENRIQALKTGADDFLNKPVETTELKVRVESLLKIKAYNDHMIHYQQELEAEVQKKTSQLQSAFESIKKASLESIHLLASAMEYRDNETGAHNQRMSRYSEAVARKIGFCEEATVRLLYASPMHDVGKIGIPDRILFKPARLDSEEMDIMKRHTTIGAEILKNSDIDYIQLAEIIALNHHEKWDGTGYPEGLAGEEIPLSGRIVALADVFDALISKRPYKDPIPLDRSFEIIREGRGTHFDPALTDAFLDIHDDILAIIRRF